MTNQKKAYIYALATVLMWSTVASAFKLTLKYVSPAEMLFMASIVSTLVFAIILIIRGEVRSFLRVDKKAILWSALFGFLNPFLYYLVLFEAYSLLPAQEAQPLNYTWAVVVVLLSALLLKQKISLKSILALIISFSGVTIIATHGNLTNIGLSNPLGIGLALSSSIIWALYFVLNLKDKREETAKLFLNFLFGTFYILIFQLYSIGIPKFEIHAVAGSVYIGIFEMGLSFVCWMKALALSVNTAKVSNLIFLSPFLSLFWINIIVGETILISTLFGLALILVGVILQQYKGADKENIMV